MYLKIRKYMKIIYLVNNISPGNRNTKAYLNINGVPVADIGHNKRKGDTCLYVSRPNS